MVVPVSVACLAVPPAGRAFFFALFIRCILLTECCGICHFLFFGLRFPPGLDAKIPPAGRDRPHKRREVVG